MIETPLRETNEKNGAISPIYSIGYNVRKEQEEKQKLEKENFDMKIKLYHLEETVRNLNHEGGFSEENRASISHLTLLIDQKELELRERNILLRKANGTIESLKTEVGFSSLGKGK